MIPNTLANLLLSYTLFLEFSLDRFFTAFLLYLFLILHNKHDCPTSLTSILIFCQSKQLVQDQPMEKHSSMAKHCSGYSKISPNADENTDFLSRCWLWQKQRSTGKNKIRENKTDLYRKKYLFISQNMTLFRTISATEWLQGIKSLLPHAQTVTVLRLFLIYTAFCFSSW